MTPACATPLVHQVRTLTPPGPVAPPPYSPPTPIYCPDHTPNPASTNIVNSPAHCSDGSVIINPDCQRSKTPVFKRQSVLTLKKKPKAHKNNENKVKRWQKVQSELSKELLKFSKDVMENIGTYDQLVNFAMKCDIPLTWVDRAKEDYPTDSMLVVNQVFYEWWDRCNLNLCKKIQMIQVAFGYIGKPAIFNRIIYTCADVEMLLDHTIQDKMPPLFNADSRTGMQKPHILESVEMLACKKIKAGKITAVQHDLIHLLSEMITSQDHYETLCESLEMPPEYGQMAKP